MIETQKRVTVHGGGSFFGLTAFRFSGKDDPLLRRAGFGETRHIAVIRWGFDPQIGVENEKGYAPTVTHNHFYPELNAAVMYILHNYDKLAEETHLEVSTDGPSKDWHQLKVTATAGLQFR